MNVQKVLKEMIAEFGEDKVREMINDLKPIKNLEVEMDFKLEDLSVGHDYYCSDSNFHSNDASARFETFADFYEEFNSADVDMNLVFRWDLHQREESKRYYLEIFMIHQRKGIFSPIHIAYFDEKDIPLFVEYLKPHIKTMKNIWKPFEL